MSKYFRTIGIIELFVVVIAGVFAFGYYIALALKWGDTQMLLLVVAITVVYALFAPAMGLFLISYADVLDKVNGKLENN